MLRCFERDDILLETNSNVSLVCVSCLHELHMKFVCDGFCSLFSFLLTQPDKPSAPKSVKVIGTGKGTISIEWEVPTKDGGAPITGYIIELCPTSETAYTPIHKVDAKTLNFDITGLKDGGNYYIGVRSENDAGISRNAAEIELPVTAKAPKSKFLFLFLIGEKKLLKLLISCRVAGVTRNVLIFLDLIKKSHFKVVRCDCSVMIVQSILYEWN